MTLASLKRHAERYGPEGVLETAAEHLDFKECCELLRHLDALERKAAGRWAKRHKLTVEERVGRLFPEAA